MENIIQSLWIGRELSTMEELCIESYLQNGHEFHLYSYDTISNVPQGTIIKDANLIVDSDEIFLDNRSGIASFSDYFRYKLLYEQGNCWTDLDMVCLKPIDFKDDFVFSSEYDRNGIPIVNIGFIKSPPGADFLAEILELITVTEFQDVRWGSFGPLLFNQVLKSYESEKYIKMPAVFCSVNWFDFRDLVAENAKEVSDEVYAIHLWNEMWRMSNLDKDGDFPLNSIYEKLKMKYLKKRRITQCFIQ